MFNSFTQYEDEFSNWVTSGEFSGLKEETKEFILNLTRPDREKKLWKVQRNAILRTIYAYEILGKKNLLLNIVTGGGKTLIIASIVAWLKTAHRSNKFLILVPNLIVRDRLEVDFRSAKVFKDFALLPPNYEEKVNELSLHVFESGSYPAGALESGVMIGNIQQFYPNNISGKRNLGYLMNFVGDLVVFNDEAHNTPAPEYSETLTTLSHKCLFRLDTTATPDRADGQTPDSEMIYHYDIPTALEDGIIKSIVVYEPEVKAVELAYTNPETGERKQITELDKEFEQAEKLIKPFQWILDLEPMKKQMRIALDRLEEQRKRAAERFKPVLFVVTMGIEEAKRAKSVLEDVFKVKTLLVTEESEENEREEARNIGTFESKYDAVVSVLMLREGWDVPQVSVILLLRKFSSPVYGQQVIGRGLRKVIRSDTEREILAVVDHPKLRHDWLWQILAVSKIRQNVLPEDEFGNEDIPTEAKIQRLVRAEKVIKIPDPEYETPLDTNKIREEIADDTADVNWKSYLDSVEYLREEWTINKVKVEQIQKRTLSAAREMEIIHGPGEVNGALSETHRTIAEKRDALKHEILALARGLLQEAGFGGMRTGLLYNVLVDHIRKKILNNKSLSEAHELDIDFALYSIENIRNNFPPSIVAGIMEEQNGNE
jgi:type III restriction enzyme